MREGYGQKEEHRRDETRGGRCLVPSSDEYERISSDGGERFDQREWQAMYGGHSVRGRMSNARQDLVCFALQLTTSSIHPSLPVIRHTEPSYTRFSPATFTVSCNDVHSEFHIVRIVRRQVLVLTQGKSMPSASK